MIDIMKFLYYIPAKELSFLYRNQDIFIFIRLGTNSRLVVWLPLGGRTPY